MKPFRAGVILIAGLFSLALLSGSVSPLAAEEKAPAAPAAVEVHLTEYSIQMPTTLPAGPTTFALHNDGIKKHALKIEGPGIEGEQSAILDAKSTGELKVTLQPGEYKVYCPLGNHSGKGMSVKLTVPAKP